MNDQEPRMDFRGQEFLRAQVVLQDRSMVVLPEEREWALNIREAVNDSERLEPLRDFDYVQYAIVTQGNVQDALVRIEGMQEFKREYRISNSVEQGLEHLERTMQLLPGFILHLDNCPDTNEGILVWDASVFKPKFLLSASCEEGQGPDFYWKTYVVASYYMTYICQPSFASIREGLMLILDCAQVEWINVSMDFEQRMHDELRTFYPLKWKKILAYNTALIANLGWSLFKRFMNPCMRESLQIGCQIVGLDPSATTPTRLHELFLQPSPEVARNNILRRARDLLIMRADKARNFKL